MVDRKFIRNWYKIKSTRSQLQLLYSQPTAGRSPEGTQQHTYSVSGLGFVTTAAKSKALVALHLSRKMNLRFTHMSM